MTKQNITGPLREQSDWNQQDENRLGYIKNKPFYDARQTTSLTLEWDGIIGDRETTTMLNDTYVKLSEMTPTLEEIKKGNFHLYLSTNGATEYPMTYALDGTSTMGVALDAIYLDNEYKTPYLVVAREHIEIEGLSFSPGIYVAYGETTIDEQEIKMFISRVHFPEVFTGELKTLDPKFLPSQTVTYFCDPIYALNHDGWAYLCHSAVLSDESIVTNNELKEAISSGKNIRLALVEEGVMSYTYPYSFATLGEYGRVQVLAVGTVTQVLSFYTTEYTPS